MTVPLVCTGEQSVPTKCSSAADRAAREMATIELFGRRARTTHPGEQQRLLEPIAAAA
jgi:RNA polymerase sigma-B factor